MPAAPEPVPARFPARGSQTGPAATAGERRSSPRHRGHPGRWYFRGSPLKLGSKLFKCLLKISVIKCHFFVDPSDPHLHAPCGFSFVNQLPPSIDPSCFRDSSRLALCLVPKSKHKIAVKSQHKEVW